MKNNCFYVSETPLGNLCTLTNSECLNLHEEKCDEPEWKMLMQLAEEYEE